MLWVLFMLAGCQSQTGPAEASLDHPSTEETPGDVYTGRDKDSDTTNQTILFFGNSLTAGYGIELDQAYPALIQEKIDSLGLPYEVVNAGLSGETTTSGLNRMDWVLKQHIDIFILELGGNDGLRGIDPQLSKQNLGRIIEKVRQSNPEVKVVLAGMDAPPNMGQAYTQAFHQIYDQVAREYDVVYIDHFLEGVGGDPALNLPDGIHPTPEGHRILAQNVWTYLEPLLDRTDQAS